VHVAILVGAETLVRKDPRLAWLVGAAILAELAAAIFLIARQNANFKLPSDKAKQAGLGVGR
jgi:lipopolysaccharide export system permease protein